MFASFALQYAPCFTTCHSFLGMGSPTLPVSIALEGYNRLKKSMKSSLLAAKPVIDTERQNELLLRVASLRDKGAFVELFEFYAPRLKSYLMKHGASDSMAEEVVQNTFVTVWEKAEGFNPDKASASTWIFTIARNKRIDLQRREKFIDANVDDAVLDTMAAPETADSYADTDTVEKLEEALQSLPDEQAKLLRMAFYEDKSHRDIADETSIPLGTVKSRLRLAMDKLRQKLGSFTTAEGEQK